MLNNKLIKKYFLCGCIMNFLLHFKFLKIRDSCPEYIDISTL